MVNTVKSRAEIQQKESSDEARIISVYIGQTIPEAEMLKRLIEKNIAMALEALGLINFTNYAVMNPLLKYVVLHESLLGSVLPVLGFSPKILGYFIRPWIFKILGFLLLY